MADSTDPIIDSLIRDFGGNYTFALDLLDTYKQDRNSLEPSWREYFDRLNGAAAYVPEAAPVAAPASPPQAQPAAAAPAERATLVRQEPTAVARPQSKAIAVPAILPGDIANPIRGGALRIVENMALSLEIPTATSVRQIPVRTLEENRRILNKHREATGGTKISFTHIIAWAILRGIETFPRLNDAYAVIEGQPHRIQRDEIRFGLAVDVQKKDGSRTLMVPNVKRAERMSFAEFLKGYEEVVQKARKGTISPDDFMGTTVTLTNPGTVGTTASAPRLMPGQGLIVATGALDYPAEYRSMAPRTLSLLGISKVMTLTSTYDHRIIQGAESGLFLARMEEMLRGEGGFYERIFEDVGLPYSPVQWEIDAHPGLFGPSAGKEEIEKQARVLQLINAYRVRGHLVADLDPLDSRRAPNKELDPAFYGLTIWDLDREFFTNGLAGTERATLRDILEILRDTYCGVIGAEYMFIADRERKSWLQVRMESSRNRAPLDAAGRRRIMEKLAEAESFERYLHAKYVGHKRFSLEGCEALIPLLDRVLSDAARDGVREVVIGMPHRGRLNVLANTVGKPLAQIFSEFEGNLDPDTTQGSGDVKYHLGASGTHEADTGQTLAMQLAPNPSHLEWVNPVVEGMVRARQDRTDDRGRDRVVPLLMHGDAAFAGQGVVAETLNFAGLDGYTTGGTIHIVVNNQIGFTTLPHDARSSTYCTDVAKMVQAPIFHVNGDDPEAVVHVAALAFEYRKKYKRDVVIDLVGYRRWGHNEGDEPSYTQPLMYAKIKSHPSVGHIYGEQLVRTNGMSRADLDAIWAQKKADMQKEGDGGPLAHIARRAPEVLPDVDASALLARLRTTLGALSSVPADFDLHPKLASFLKKRAELLEGRGEVDWATGESLAFGTLLLEGIPVRLSGQDSGRGTFSQRHSVLFDVRTGKEHVPLNALAPAGCCFEVHDSLLSEAAVMGFELGYAVAEHRGLVLWEAQFGDFANGAQVIIDQFLAGSETKWGQPVDLVLLLPHGHEGQGPEHSSARLERFLTLCAQANMRVCYPSTPGSYFHLLRRQARDPIEKPLVVMTPKSLLRHPRCVSPLPELAEGRFEPVLDDAEADAKRVRRIVLTSGKLYYDLLKAREDKHRGEVALVRLEQLYPFPDAELDRVLAGYDAQCEILWAQEEPKNMGPWRFVREQFLDGCLREARGRQLRYVGRGSAASPAPGSHKVHVEEQEAILEQALALPEQSVQSVTTDRFAAPATS